MATSDSTVQIPLTQGYTAIVDCIDADLAQYKWRVIPKSSMRFYAARAVTLSRGHKYTVQMHRVILERILGRQIQKNEMVDHIDGNGLNNQRSNLRLASNAQNQQNARKSATNTSGYKGVRYNKGKWMARISVNGNRLYLGVYDTPEQAYEAYCAAALMYHREFARFN